MGRSIALNKSGDAYITGSTDSTDFPVTNAFNTTASGGQDAFVAWISSVRPDRGLQFFG